MGREKVKICRGCGGARNGALARALCSICFKAEKNAASRSRYLAGRAELPSAARRSKIKICTKCGEQGPLVTHRTICHPCNLERKRDVAARQQLTSTGAAHNRAAAKAYRQTPSGRAGLLMFFAARRAKDIGRDFNLARDDIAKRIANGQCEVTGLPFDLKPRPDRHHSNPWAPSLDRRDSAKGYTQENVQVVVAAYNLAKSEWTEDVLLTLARAIVDANR